MKKLMVTIVASIEDKNYQLLQFIDISIKEATQKAEKSRENSRREKKFLEFFKCKRSVERHQRKIDEEEKKIAEEEVKNNSDKNFQRIFSVTNPIKHIGKK